MPDGADVSVVIPARFESTRFRGKPLAAIDGTPMIERTWEQCRRAVGADRVWVATDDERIAAHARSCGIQFVMTSPDHATGTDRLAEAADRLPGDVIVNVQGDEPLIPPADIRSVIAAWDGETAPVVNGMCEILDERSYRDVSVPKVLTDVHGGLLYASRGPVPHAKDGTFVRAWRQVCVYAFSRSALASFAGHPGKTPLEAIEDIEILRFVELGYRVQMVPVSSTSIAVDHPADIARVEAALLELGGPPT